MNCGSRREDPTGTYPIELGIVDGLRGWTRAKTQRKQLSILSYQFADVIGAPAELKSPQSVTIHHAQR